MRPFAVDRLRPHEQSPVVAALARAFFDDPLFGFFVPNLVKQQKSLIAFMRAGVKDAAPFGDCYVARRRQGRAAIWLPPGGPRCGARSQDLLPVVPDLRVPRAADRPGVRAPNREQRRTTNR
jgi:hypothetical protein